ncbi:hypothetical protein N7520_003022 [Penicillium odoratum]|uniref:uncharacterized protein n=1 Tax=Penicillium odoratum TaxID=1167516 RepID=UPI00254868E7|nr:uncharacterized protein N7520_003022 [Penicillium odoratum]KAJ5772493.1 hypothetical protein N7520_003022 [Penicillium odoratum]
MPSTVNSSPDSTRARRESGPRPQARSAGGAERAPRNESLSDLVRFFQTQNMPAQAIPPTDSPDSPTALPVVLSPEPKEPVIELTKEELKPFRRRLLHFSRQKKESTPKSKADENQRQLEALQREGYLMSSKPKSTLDRPKNSLDRSKTSLISLDRPKSSLERTFSRSKKQDVEAIGRPWLTRTDSNTESIDPKRRLASLDLDDFGSMLDGTISLSEFEDTSPPPYQQAHAHSDQVSDDQISGSQQISPLPLPRASSEARSRSIDQPVSSSASMSEIRVSESRDRDPPWPPSSINMSSGADRNPPPASQSISNQTAKVQVDPDQLKSEPKQDKVEQPQAPDHLPPNPPGIPSPPSLKLFPDVAPPRLSSINALRLSSAPRYQTTTKTAPPPPGTQSKAAGTEAEKPRQSTESYRSKTAAVPEEPVCSGALPSVVSKNPPAATPKPRAVSAHIQTGQRKSRPSSLAMGTLQAFPLPAPTRPLPSIPKSNTLAPPVDPRTPMRTVRSGSKLSEMQYSQPSPIAEEPRELGTRAASTLGHSEIRDDVKAPETTSEHPEHYTPRRRSSSVHVYVPRMHELAESSSDGSDGQPSNDQPLADSPVLGQSLPKKPQGKHAAPKGLQINSCVDQSDLPFGLPSPPPSAALPLDPPEQRSERTAHRNYTAPVDPGLLTSRSMEMAMSVPRSQQGSLLSRSNSSRSSLRHESIPESHEHARQAESPLPSSDDEGFGPRAGKQPSYRVAEKHQPRAHSMRRGYETLDARSTHSRPRYPHQMRPLTPQGHSHSYDPSLSPQSQYSQATSRSRHSQSQSIHRAPAPPHDPYLEDRIANLERQNQVLQAALMAALNAGVKPNMDLHESAIPPSFPAAGHGDSYQGRRFTSRPDSWMSSSRSSDISGFETPGSVRDARVNARQLDNMLEDIESGWISDKSSLSGARSMVRHR